MSDIGTLVTSGSLLLAIPIAFLAGIIAFVSPCVLPLAPGYVSYVTGLTGAELAESSRRGRVLLGSLGFVAGFSIVFVSYGAFFGGMGAVLLQNEAVITRILGVLVILMGLAFMGLIPGCSASTGSIGYPPGVSLEHRCSVSCSASVGLRASDPR